jgi:hypothetical protein
MNILPAFPRGAILFALMVTLLTTSDAHGAPGAIYTGNPSNYRSLLSQLQPGDTLNLVAGAYTQGLPLDGQSGAPGAPITIAGPDSGGAVFTPRSCCNTVSLRDSSYVIIRNLELDGQQFDVDAVKAESDAPCSHDVLLENLYIHDFDGNQQNVGVSTKCLTWNWVIRLNIIERVGTGMYLGDSTGDAQFINGLIEYNLMVDTIGYNAQIKHQNPRPSVPGMPTGDNSTIIRHNVFSKSGNSSTGGEARPNLLVGHWPLSGVGMNDIYLIYGNFFYRNPSGEALFQGEGNIALYNNLFVNNDGSAVWIQQHEDVPRLIRAFYNTVVASGEGIRVSNGHTGYTQKVIGNAVFAGTPISAADQQDNTTGAYASASAYLNDPSGAPPLDLYPKSGQLTGSIDTSSFNTYEFWNFDFNSDLRGASRRGAYAGSGSNPGWLAQLQRKPISTIDLPNKLYLPLTLK